MNTGHLYIDIHNDPEILQTIIDSIPFLPTTWEVAFNATPPNMHWNTYPNKTARYFVFHFKNKEFSWAFDDSGPIPNNFNFYTIRDIAYVSKLMDKIYEIESSNNNPKIPLPIGPEI